MESSGSLTKCFLNVESNDNIKGNHDTYYSGLLNMVHDFYQNMVIKQVMSKDVLSREF